MLESPAVPLVAPVPTVMPPLPLLAPLPVALAEPPLLPVPPAPPASSWVSPLSMPLLGLHAAVPPKTQPSHTRKAERMRAPPRPKGDSHNLAITRRVLSTPPSGIRCRRRLAEKRFVS